MRGYLQSQDRAKDRLCVGPDELSLVEAAESEALPLLGSYSFVAGERVLFYRWHGDLRLRFGDAPPITLHGLRAGWRVVSGQVNFELRCGDRTVYCRNYPVNRELLGLDQDPTPFVEAEDFDFLLFVRNVVSDLPRANRIYRAS